MLIKFIIFFILQTIKHTSPSKNTRAGTFTDKMKMEFADMSSGIVAKSLNFQTSKINFILSVVFLLLMISLSVVQNKI